MTFPLLQRLTKVQSRGRHKENFVGTRNPLEPTFWVPTWNPEPTGTHIFEIRVGSTRNPWVPGFRTCRPLLTRPFPEEIGPWTKN